jgi:alkylation response protein AidB-like acyl-CoA dehydrogenase
MSTTTGPNIRRERPPEVSEREARQVAEAARETEWNQPSFVRELFLGQFRMDLLYPLSAGDPAERARAEIFLEKLRQVAATVDGEAIEREAKVPDSVIDALREIGAFGIKIPEEYGGLGLSQHSYNRAIALIGAKVAALGVLLSAHQSIGVPQPLKIFGTPEQKQKYLPRLARGAISAFALTEPDVGSDPARMGAHAEPTEDGSAYLLNGEKLWCTNGPIAELMVVMARTPAPQAGGRAGITAFIVESDWEGVELAHRSDFMGLHGIENGVMRFTNVRVPRENVLLGEGRGLKLALVTLNTGRLTIPATSAAAGKYLLRECRIWAAERRQWGAPIGKHEAVAQMLADMATKTFAMEAISEISSRLADAGASDIRLEAAMAKMINSELAWQVVDTAMQIRGGRGYETTSSLASRGEKPVAIERAMRDLRINLIFEGSSEIMRLFIAREAVDPHLQRAGAMVDSDAAMSARLRGVASLGLHFAGWLPRLVAGRGIVPGSFSDFGPGSRHLRYVERTSRKLGRMLFMAMSRFGPKLEKKQAVLFRLVDIGAELFGMAAVVAYARHLTEQDPANQSPWRLADLHCRNARRRIRTLVRDVFRNHDGTKYRVAMEVLDGRHSYLESDIPE